MAEEEITQFVYDPIISGVVVGLILAGILGGITIIRRKKLLSSSKNIAINHVKAELQNYSDFIDKIKDELHFQYDSIIEIKNPELIKETEKMLDFKTKCFVVHYFDKLTLEEKTKFFDIEILKILNTTYKEIREFAFNMQYGFHSRLKNDVLELKQTIDDTIKKLD